VAFELSGERNLLLLFPNVFELWFLVVAAIHRYRPRFAWRALPLVATLVALVAVKELHEWALHGARLFDSISSLEAIDIVWRWVTGDRE